MSHIATSFKVQEVEVDANAISPLVFGLLTLDTSRPFIFWAYPQKDSNDGTRFSGTFSYIQHNYMSKTLSSKLAFAELQTTEQPPRIDAQWRTSIWIQLEGRQYRYQQNFYVVGDETIRSIVQERGKIFGSIIGAKGDPDALFSMSHAKLKGVIHSARIMAEMHKGSQAASNSARTRVVSGETTECLAPAKILALPVELLTRILRMVTTTTDGEVVVSPHPKKKTLRFLQRKICFPGVVLCPLEMSIFRVNRRLSAISQELFYKETKFYFQSPDALERFNNTILYGQREVTQITLLEWNSLDNVGDLVEKLPSLRVLEIWTTKQVLSKAKLRFTDPQTSKCQCKVLLYESGDDDNDWVYLDEGDNT